MNGFQRITELLYNTVIISLHYYTVITPAGRPLTAACPGILSAEGKYCPVK